MGNFFGLYIHGNVPNAASQLIYLPKLGDMIEVVPLDTGRSKQENGICSACFVTNPIVVVDKCYWFLFSGKQKIISIFFVSSHFQL